MNGRRLPAVPFPRESESGRSPYSMPVSRHGWSSLTNYGDKDGRAQESRDKPRKIPGIRPVFLAFWLGICRILQTGTSSASVALSVK